MIKKTMLGAIALACGGMGLSAQAATVTLSQFAYGANNVKVTAKVPKRPGFVGTTTQTITAAAGAFSGSVSFGAGEAHGFSGVLNDFITYCVELDQSFTLSSTPMTGYSVIAAADYAHWSDKNSDSSARNDRSDKADRIGKLIGHVAAQPSYFVGADHDDRSTAVQLALWNIIYDNDHKVDSGNGSGSGFRLTGGSSAAINSLANGLLGLDFAALRNPYEVFVLSRDTGPATQDFLLLREVRVPAQSLNQVPEPAGLALAALALGAAGIATRRRMTRR